jgi:hypothetical protein
MLYDEPGPGAQPTEGSDLEEWILVYLPSSDAPPKRATRKHYELNLKAKGFKIHGDEDKPAKKKSGKADRKDEESS